MTKYQFIVVASATRLVKGMFVAVKHPARATNSVPSVGVRVLEIRSTKNLKLVLFNLTII